MSENDTTMDIRDRIRACLDEQGLSIQGASLKAGLGQTTLRDFLNDEDRSITVRTLEKLAPVLGKTVKWIQTGEDDDDPEVAELINIFRHMPKQKRKTVMDVAKGLDDTKRQQS